MLHEKSNVVNIKGMISLFTGFLLLKFGRFWELECFFEFARSNIPQTDRTVITPTYDCSSVRTEGGTTDLSGMSFKRFLVFPGGSIPYTDGPISTCGGKQLPISTEGYAIDTFLMSLDGFLVFSCRGIPQTNGFVLKPRETQRLSRF